MSLETLAQFAVSNNNTSQARTPLHSLSIEDARAKVKVKDGNKVAKADGEQALTLTLGKHTLSLDVIKAGTTRLNITADQVEDVTANLQEAVDGGQFDDAIVAAQAKSDPANRKPAASAPVEPPSAPESVDLDALDNSGVSEESSDELDDELG